MPLIGMWPMTDEVMKEFDGAMPQLRQTIRLYVSKHWHTTESDVIVNLFQCVVKNLDPHSARMLIYIESNPGEHEKTANELRDMIAEILSDLGLARKYGVEIWPQFIPGPWGWLENGALVLTYNHPTS